MMIEEKRTSVLIIALLVGLLFGNVVGEIFGFFIPEDSVVVKVLVNAFEYEQAPISLNLIMLTLTIGFSLKINLISLVGIAAAWYYVKYSY
ncbi:MAG: DUF4321 domain-containing protein [Candidatus Latescibacterota bacterium]